MNRIFLIVLGFSYLFISCHISPTQEKPNIVFIFTDDQGYGDVGCFGATDIETPNIDLIAEEGIKFTEFYSASPVCSPSRAGLLTGRMPQRMGIHGVFFPESFTGMPPDEITIAEILKEEGYKTGIVGKWHLGHMPKFLPLNQGFDEYYGIPYSNDMESVVYLSGNEVDSFVVNQTYTTRTYTRKAVDFINRHKNEAFYLYLAHNMPHVPIYASPPFRGKSNRGLYGDVIQEIDWSVGEIIRALRENGILDNTIIVFSSDNGPWLVMEDHGGSAGILREGKQYTFEGGVRVPTVAMWKKRIKPGSIYNDLATQMDWFPTFINIVGAKLPDDRIIDGIDITNVLFGEGKRENNTFIYYNGGDPRCFREGNLKIKKPFPGTEPVKWRKAVAAHDSLLFDLKSDPGESKNLASVNPHKLAELFKKMENAVESMGELPPPIVIKSPSDNSHYLYLENKHINSIK